MPLSAPLVAFRDYLLEQEGKPYLWGSKGFEHELPSGGSIAAFDCSGLVCCAIKAAGGPDWRLTHNAASLVGELGPLLAFPPRSMCLAVYGSPHIDHVMVVFEDGRVFGASGGGSECTSIDVSIRKGAAVHFRPSARYRADFRGFLPLPSPLR